MQRGIRVVVPDDLYPGANWSEGISRKIGDVDLVIGVLTSERRSQWILFELGQAAALGRQIVLIAPPKLAEVPSHLKRFLVIRAGPKNRGAIDFALDQILASPERSKTPPIASPSKPALGSDADPIITDLRWAIESNDYRGVERVVVQALRGSGAEIVSEASNPDLGADIAVWSDALQTFVGNPLLIEVKSRIHGADELRRAANQLFAAVTSRGGNWGLLLYGQGPQDLALSPKGLPPTVLVYSIGELIEQLRTRSFAEVIRDLRNRRVHGGER
jgi:hypothetical protein